MPEMEVGDKFQSFLEEDGVDFSQILQGIENINIPIYVVTLSGKITFANKGCANLANFRTPKELIGKRCYEIFRSENCHTDKCPLRIYAEGSTPVERQVNLRVTLPNGKIKYIRANHAPIMAEGKIWGVIKLFEDFTEVKESSIKVMDMLISLAEGDLSRTLKTKDLHSDFKEIGEALNTLSISLDLGLRNISEAVRRIAEGNFSTKVEWEMPGIYAEIAENINQATQQLDTIIKQIRDVCTAIRDGDLAKMVDVSELDGVFADIGNVINEMSISLDLGLRNISEAVNRIAEGNFTGEVEWEMPGIYLEIINRINGAIKHAFDVDMDRREALEQLAANLMQFETSADRLRNPLAVIMSSLELKDEFGKDRVLEIVDEYSKRIKKELDEMREEEINTFLLTEKSIEKLG